MCDWKRILIGDVPIGFIVEAILRVGFLYLLWLMASAERTGLSKQRVFAELRSNQIFHLGEVNKLYLEANGKFTLVRSGEKRPCLNKTFNFVCDNCGYPDNRSNKTSNCPSCGRKQWRLAITNAEKSPEEVAVGQQQKELYHG